MFSAGLWFLSKIDTDNVRLILDTTGSTLRGWFNQCSHLGAAEISD